MSFCFLILLTPKPSTTLLPYTTLFRSPRLLAIHSEVGAADVRNNHSRSGARRARRGRAAQGAVPLALRSEEPRLNSSHVAISYAVFCLKKKRKNANHAQTEDGRPESCA